MKTKVLASFICFIALTVLMVYFIDLDDNLMNSHAKKLSQFRNSHIEVSALIQKPETTTVKKVVHHFRPIYDNDTSCYSEPSDANGLLEFDPKRDKEDLKLGKSIFFHETSCFGEEGLIINARQACAVESAAKMNPNMTVFLLFLSPSKMSDASNHVVQQLLSYKNIRIRRININNYIKDTPLEKWYAKGILQTSNWPRSHMSDILRYLSLWKYGGIYLDLDFVIIKSLENISNFAGTGDVDTVYSGVIGFGMEKLGRKLAEDSINDLIKNFRGEIWGHNGPGVISRILEKHCGTKYTANMTTSQCQGFTVYPASVFYPIFYPSWRRYFMIDKNNETMKELENSKAIHVWNFMSKSEKIKVGSEVPYAKMAEKYCSKVYSNCGPIF